MDRARILPGRAEPNEFFFLKIAPSVTNSPLGGASVATYIAYLMVNYTPCSLAIYEPKLLRIANQIGISKRRENSK